jgi:transcriptional regulator with XRE-family HTH domain
VEAISLRVPLTEAEFNADLIERVRRLRKERRWTAEQMATALGISPDRYRKYESRTPLPHYLVERFALIVGRDIDYVLTGKSGHRKVPVA